MCEGRYHPPEAEIGGQSKTDIENKPEAETGELTDITKSPEWREACKNTELSGDINKELLRLGVERKKVKKSALARLAKYIRQGYGYKTLCSMATQGGVITTEEVDMVFAKVKAEMLAETPSETAEKKAQREAK